MKFKKYTLVVLLMVMVSACAGPITLSPKGSTGEIQRETEREKELAYKRITLDKDRIFNISFSVLSANTDFCENKTYPSFGMTFWNINTESRAFYKTAARLYGLHKTLAIQFIADTSPAAKAGLKSGDLIISIQDKEIPQGAGAKEVAYDLLNKAGYLPTKITVKRKGMYIKRVIGAVKTCAYPVLLDYNNTDLNAFTDGKNIVISKGIIRFAENDNEIALIIAHELGHNAMSHIKKQQTNAMIGGIGGLAIDALLNSAGISSGRNFGRMGQNMGARRHSVAFEQEADYVGMYLMENAGYNSKGVADFWRRMAIEAPQSVSARTTHPTSPERFIAIEHTHKEIMQKKARKERLVPNLKAK